LPKVKKPFLRNQMENISCYYDKLAPDYDQSRFGNTYGQFLHDQEHRVLTRWLGHIPAAHTLDLACGTGRLLEFAETGLDKSPNMLQEARQKHPGKKLVVGDAAKMPFPDNCFEAVFSFHFFMHLDRDYTGAVLTEAWRVLRPGGRFIVDVPSQKRRSLTGGHSHGGWHGSGAMDVSEWAAELDKKWQMVDRQGILFLPVHRIPARWRAMFLPFDNLLCHSFLKEYASYLVLCLVKK